MKACAAALALCLPLAAVAGDLGITRCVNLGDALDTPSVEGEWGYTIETRDIEMIVAAGFDTVRLPVRFSSRWEGDRIEPAFLARVDAVIRGALDRGLIVILDLHHYEPLMADPAGEAQTFAAIWAALGAHYAGWPDGLYFELLNEPSGAMTTDVAAPMFAEIIAGLRPAHPDRWIIVSGGDWGNIDQMLTLPDFGPRTAHSFHYYSPFEFTHQQVPWHESPMPARGWDAATGAAAVKAEIARARQSEAPLFLGEFGTYRKVDPDSRMAWLATVRRTAEEADIGWCAWSFASNFGLVTHDKRAWLPGVTEALGLRSAEGR